MGFHLLPGGLSRMKCLLGEHNGAEVSNHFATGPLLASTPRSERRECHILSAPINRYVMITIVQWLCGMSSAPMMDWGGCYARQDPTQRTPEVAGLRSDRQWHSRERARQWTLMTSAGGLQQLGKVTCVEEIRPGYIYSSPFDGMGPSTSGRTWLRQSRFLGLMRAPGFGETGPDTGRTTVLSRQPAPAWWPPCTERSNQLIADHAVPGRCHRCPFL